MQYRLDVEQRRLERMKRIMERWNLTEEEYYGKLEQARVRLLAELNNDDEL
jgi:hypothetical protein